MSARGRQRHSAMASATSASIRPVDLALSNLSVHLPGRGDDGVGGAPLQDRVRPVAQLPLDNPESSLGPENFFAQTPSTERLPPFRGGNRFWTGFWEWGHEQFSESKSPPYPGGRICGRTSSQITLISPEVAEPVGRKLGVSDSVLDVLVAEIVLQGSSIVSVVGELIAARMPQHVRMQ
jgi:hypothetical protein